MTDAMTRVQAAREVAFWLSAAFTNRRLHSADNPVAKKNLAQLMQALASYFEDPTEDRFALGALPDRVSLGGTSELQPSDSVAKLAAHMRSRGFEILTVLRAATVAEVEALLALLNLDPTELTAIDVGRWLRERGAVNVSMTHLSVIERSAPQSMRELYSNARESMGREVQRALTTGAMELSAMMEVASGMMALVLDSAVPIATMCALRGRHQSTFVHSTNVSVLATAQAAALGFEETLVRQIGVAALVHDIGKMVIPPEILHKTTPLNDAEQAMLDRHAGEGARMLLRSQGASGLEAIVAAEHHTPYTEDPHVASQIVAIADVFDNLRTMRPFANRENVKNVLAFMLEKMKHLLNPYLLQRFCLMCGMYALGDVVQLSTGEIARVVAQNVELGNKPVVEVVDTAHGALPAGVDVDLSQPPRPMQITQPTGLAYQNVTLDDLGALG